MNKFEKQVVTKLNKKLEKYGLSREELELKLHSGAVYGSTVMKMVDNNDKPFCKYHDVACGTYECPYADTVNNTIICNAKNCIYQSIYTPVKVESGTLSGKTVISLSNMSDEDYPF